MRSSKIILFIVLGLALLVSVTFPATIKAQQLTKLSVSPVTFELNANPGDKLVNQIKVSNLSDSELLLETKIENIVSTGDRGQVQLTVGDTSYSLSKWVSVDVAKFSLAPKEVRNLTFTIQVPTNAEPGGHYGSLLFGTIASATSGSTGVGVGQKLGTLLLVKVSGQSNENAIIKSIAPKSYNGEWDEKLTVDGEGKILVPKTNDLSNVPTQKYFDHGPIAFDLKFNNLGNVHVKPSGFVTIYNVFQRKIVELPIDQRNVFPGSDRQIAVIWPKSKLWGGYYRAEATAVYGSSNQLMTNSIAFWVFPKVIAIVLAVLLLIFVFIRKRIARAIRILIRGA